MQWRLEYMHLWYTDFHRHSFVEKTAASSYGYVETASLSRCRIKWNRIKFCDMEQHCRVDGMEWNDFKS